MIKLINAKVITSKGVSNNKCVVVGNEHIIYVGDDTKHMQCDTIDLKGNYVSAGFIDLHVHGGAGSSFMDYDQISFKKVVKYHEKQGTLNLMPTSLTAANNEIYRFLELYTQMKSNDSVKDSLLGVHMEGPFLSTNKCGAQDGLFCTKVDVDECQKYLDKCSDIKRMTIAPEMDEGFQLAHYLRERNISVSAGHTDCLYETMTKALNSGYDMITHMYSSMNGITMINGFRNAGAIEAILLNDDVCVELIADGKHLPAPIIELVYKLKGKDNIIFVSDAMRATGTDAKESYIGKKIESNKVIIEDGVAKMKERKCLGGSITPLNKMVEFVYKNSNISLSDIVTMVTETPAKKMGVINELGSISAGKYADIIVFDEDIEILVSIKRGKIIKNLLMGV